MKKEYTKDDLTVVWKPDLCVHSANCIKHLPTVFKPRERPWIDMGGAEKAAIIDAVHKCPSGAISILEPVTTPVAPAPIPETEWHQVAILPNGPFRIKHACLVHLPNGEVVEKPNGVSLCRCGGSSKMPFCDGSHKTNGFAD